MPSALEIARLTWDTPSCLASTFLGPVQKVRGKPDPFCVKWIKFWIKLAITKAVAIWYWPEDGVC